MSEKMFRFSQDGADFYNESEAESEFGKHVWSAPYRVKDFDMHKAAQARVDFLRHLRDRGISPDLVEFVS